MRPRSTGGTSSTIVSPTDVTITNYQAAKLRIAQNASTSEQTKAELTAELRETTQATVEPACRCFVEETVGNVSLDGFLSPDEREAWGRPVGVAVGPDGRSLLVAEDLSAKGQDAPFMHAKITTARFYADHLLSRAPGVRDAIVEGAEAVTALPAEAF